VYTVDRCPDGYEAAASTTSLTQVNITGPESLIDSIAVAGVEVSVKDATTTLSGEAYLKFYDSDKSDAHVVDVSGNKFFSASAYKTDYTLYVNTAKTVPIQYEIGGTPASGYHYSSTSASIGSVIVMGDSDALGKLSAITIPSSVLNIDGATSSKLWNVDLNAYLPAGTTISGTHQTSITAVIEADTSSSSGGPGVTTAPETTSSSSETGDAETTAGTSEMTEAAGGPGVTVTELDKETEEGSDIQDETQAESQAETESESQSPGESSSHVTTGASADHTSYERTEVPAQTQSHTQAETHAETEPETQAETQSHMQQ
jgi:YbbR domain-containing protein